MDTEFARLVADAADIANSGRRAVVNERIEHLSANPGVGNEWWVQLFASLCYQVFSEYSLLKRAYGEGQDGDGPLLAWRARNLLELSVWSMYCAKSRGNARRLYEDAGRDALDSYNAITKWGAATAKSKDWLDPIENMKQDLSRRAEADGIESLDGHYKEINKAAKECGMGEHFSLGYKILSKFAHPTALRILAPPDLTKEAIQRDYFFSRGCLFFSGAFDILENQLKDLAP